MATGSRKVLTVGLLAPLDVLDPRMPQQESVLVLRQMLEPPFDVVSSAGDIGPVLVEGPLEKASPDGLNVHRLVLPCGEPEALAPGLHGSLRRGPRVNGGAA